MGQVSSQFPTPLYTFANGQFTLVGSLTQGPNGILVINGLASGGGGGGSGGTVLASGQVALSGGVATVANAAITATSKVAFSVTSPSNSGALTPVVSAGQVQFLSTNLSDASKVNYSVTA